MNEALSLDWWMHQIYRQTKEFINNPNTETEAKLTSLIKQYRAHHETPPAIEGIQDEHERLMDFR